MTKQEIKALIEKGIAGQGTNVDGGGYLSKILDAIVDAIPGEQVNSDWNATEGPAEILNKPTIPERVVIQGVIRDGAIHVNDESEVIRAANAGNLVYIQVSGDVSGFCLVVCSAGGGNSQAVTPSGQILNIVD